MASLLLLIFLLALLISPSQADTAICTSQTFNNNKLYANCADLPRLSSYLHWTYNASNSSLAVAFVVPSDLGSWIAWAINPTGTKMIGAQALVAYIHEDGTPVLKTYNITSYSSIVPGKLSFDVWDMSTEYMFDSDLTIFATVKVPEKAETVNQVWQVGPGVNKTTHFIEKHDFDPANLAAYGALNLATGTTTTTNTTTNTTTGGTTTNTTASGKSGAGLRIGDGGHVGLFSISLLVLGTLIVF